MKDSDFLLGIDIGGSHVGIGLIHGSSGQIVSFLEQSLSDASPQFLVDTIVEMSSRILPKDLKVNSIGVGCPGYTKDGVVVAASNFPSWRMVPLAKMISVAFRSVPVTLLNDADAALAAEIWGPKKHNDFSYGGITNAAMISTINLIFKNYLREKRCS